MESETTTAEVSRRGFLRAAAAGSALVAARKPLSADENVPSATRGGDVEHPAAGAHMAGPEVQEAARLLRRYGGEFGPLRSAAGTRLSNQAR